MSSLQLIVGMPNSGKSTFIAALTHLLIADEVPTQLKLLSLADDEQHLNRLEGEWLACERVQRTKPSTEGWVKLNIQDTSTGIQSDLLIPDLRGEAFEQPACTGQCQTTLLSALNECEGILLFSNVDRGDDTMMLDDIVDIFATGTDLGAGSAIPTQPFIPENMPEEVKIVEFLQMANRRPRAHKKRRIAVILSAWDLVDETEGITPDSWLEAQRPMLSQFLETNGDSWEFKVFGVSAQGGRLPAEKQHLEKVKIPSKRVRIVGQNIAEHDLSAPLQWLISTSTRNGS
jgi:hypothetical protein